MTPQEYLTAFRRRWRTIVVAVLVGLAVAALVTVLSPRQYDAEATIFVTSQPRNPAEALKGKKSALAVA